MQSRQTVPPKPLDRLYATCAGWLKPRVARAFVRRATKQLPSAEQMEALRQKFAKPKRT